jgi:hypothetical protein
VAVRRYRALIGRPAVRGLYVRSFADFSFPFPKLEGFLYSCCPFPLHKQWDISSDRLYSLRKAAKPTHFVNETVDKRDLSQ